MSNFRTALAALIVCSSLNAAPQGSTPRPFLGTNLEQVTYHSPQWVFVDAFRMAREWLPQEANSGTWNTGDTLDLTADGWPLLAPGQAAGTVMYRDVDGQYPGGVYTCLYEGTGRIEFRFDAEILSESPGRILVDVTPGDLGIYLKIVESDNSDPVRNIRVIMPGFENNYQSQIFHPLFIERLRGFGVLRFMNWQRTNDHEISSWNDRTTTNWYTQAGENGVALEYLIELCNRTGSDGWFCIPHLADDNYVTEFAEMVEQRLDPGLSAYIEYSNEVWNTVLEQTDYAAAEGMARGFSNQYLQAALRFQSFRAVQIFNIWENVFGSTDRLVRVLAAQAVSTYTAREVLDFQNAYLSVDAYGIAPYFGGPLGSEDNAGHTITLSVDEILDACEDDIVNNVATTIAQNVVETSARNIDLVAYEGGQGMRGRGSWTHNQTLADKFHAANRHPRMNGIYHDYLDLWRSSDGRTFIHYNFLSTYDDHGSWGALETMAQPVASAHKYRALRQVLADLNCRPPQPYCPGAPNSVGSGAIFVAEGQPSVALGDFELYASGLPTNHPGLFFYGGGTGMIPFGSGTLCVTSGGSGLYRLNRLVMTDANGEARRRIDFDARPTGEGPGTLVPGDRWHFQFMYRDRVNGVPTSNLSNALTVDICP